MADEDLTEMTENTSPDLVDLIYAVDDPEGTPLDRKVALDNLRKLLNASRHCAKMTRDAAQNIGSGSNTKILFDNEHFNVGGLSDLDTDKFTIQEPGKYLIIARTRIGGVDTGEYVQVKIYIGGSSVASANSMSSGTDRSPQPCVAEIFDLSAEDEIELYVYQNSGGTQTTLIAPDSRAAMSVIQL